MNEHSYKNYILMLMHDTDEQILVSGNTIDDIRLAGRTFFSSWSNEHLNDVIKHDRVVLYKRVPASFNLGFNINLLRM